MFELIHLGSFQVHRENIAVCYGKLLSLPRRNRINIVKDQLRQWKRIVLWHVNLPWGHLREEEGIRDLRIFPSLERVIIYENQTKVNERRFDIHLNISYMTNSFSFAFSASSSSSVHIRDLLHGVVNYVCRIDAVHQIQNQIFITNHNLQLYVQHCQYIFLLAVK